jgi:hypothetical protein
VKNLFSPPKPKQVPVINTKPQEDAAAAEQKRESRLRRGHESTIATGGMGLQTPAPIVKPTLG